MLFTSFRPICNCNFATNFSGVTHQNQNFPVYDYKMKLLLAILSLSFAAVAFAADADTETCDVKDDNCKCPKTTPEFNKALAMEFFSKVFNETNFDILDRYIGDTYIQHNPWATDGKEGYLKVKGLIEKTGVKGTVRFHRAIAEGDFVWLHSQSVVKRKLSALVDIFRVECGKLVEHWDVIMEMVPSEVNDHAYF